MTPTDLAAVPVLAPGEELAPGYRVVQHVSRGEALDVYEVFSSARLCSCVAKTVRPDRAHVGRVRDRLLREGRLLTSLAHPHLVRGFEVLDRGVPVVVTETVPGLTLEELVDLRGRRLPAADLAHLGRQLCSAVQYLHAAGSLHLDIRPGNIMASGGRAVLLDLSLARPPGQAPRCYGTEGYLSPEQARGGDVAEPADVWGLGATLHEAATGMLPVDAAAARPLRRRRLPSGLVQAVEHCLSPEPADRPTVHALWSLLGEVLAPGR